MPCSAALLVMLLRLLSVGWTATYATYGHLLAWTARSGDRQELGTERVVM